MEPTWYNFADYLAVELPELRQEIEESYLSWLEAYKDPYPHVFLDEFIGPLLVGTASPSDATTRTRAGEILDRVLTSSDDDLAGSALMSIVEVLRDERELRERAWPFLGPVARDWITRLAADRVASNSVEHT